MTKYDTLTVDIVRQLLDYDPKSGVFRWRKRAVKMFADGPRQNNACATWNSRYAGNVAGTPDKDNYLQINIFKKQYKAHRLAWFIQTGSWPEGDIDHANCDPIDSRLANLRAATRSQNHANKGTRADNTSGRKGVSWDKSRRKWVAHIGRNGRIYHLGRFNSAEDASASYSEAAQRLYGEFARTA